MTKEETIKLAEECGLTYTGQEEDGEPQFLGKQEAWDMFNKIISK